MSPTFLDLHPPHHLANDHLDVLVVDAHTLEAVDLLNLVDEELRQGLLAEDLQDVVRVLTRRPSALTGPDAVAWVGTPCACPWG